MVLRIRDKKKRVEMFLGMLDSAFINNRGKNKNLSDKLTLKFKKKIEKLCKLHNRIYDASHLWKIKTPSLFTGYKMLFDSQELKVTFINNTLARKKKIKDNYIVAENIYFTVPFYWSNSEKPVLNATYRLVIDKRLTTEEIEQEFEKMISLFECSLIYHEGKVPVFKIDLHNPEVIRPTYEKE
ncbi:hypothetical protein K3M17_004645 [Salmonella enterica]|uniref:hypothetical protein n=1 Tax=Salmonella enterica TaxID=28901 RepID=UPI0019F2DE92|nr:hypothetical protein [Escherichia coli]EHW9375053.1 hypothetical protein [Salmonella enterica]EGO3755535.1 hypothetical protein [Escherichia coli]EGO4035967.1 hypothetical protein [Escherichia coli]EJA4276212.1 hypothetical protein [Escherichia coli]